MHILLFYDDLKNANGWSDHSDIILKSTSIENHLNWCNIQFKKELINSQSISSSNLNLYVIEIYNAKKIEGAFSNIPQSTWNFIRKNNIKILIYFITESFDIDGDNRWFYRMHKCFEKYQLKEIKKYFIYNNLNIKEHYSKFCCTNRDLTDKFSKIFGYDFFQLEYYNILNEKNYPDKTVMSTLPKKNFLSLNAKMRPERMLLSSELQRLNLLDNVYYSFIGSDGIFFDDINADDAFNKLKPYKEKIPYNSWEYLETYKDNWKPCYIDADEKSLDIFKYSKEWYTNSFFSIVTETGMGFSLRLTEKTYKPIAHGHPFIVIGTNGVLRYLKSIGYQTFPEIFDESYDLEKDPIKRFFMIIDEIYKFCKLPYKEKISKLEKVKPKLENNTQLFYEVMPYKLHQQYKKMFEEMYYD